jgi:orotate phosphoribosyltransferase
MVAQKDQLETMACVKQAGGKVVGAGTLIDRSSGGTELGVPKASLVALAVQNFNPAERPLCKSGIPSLKPGSRLNPPLELPAREGHRESL